MPPVVETPTVETAAETLTGRMPVGHVDQGCTPAVKTAAETLTGRMPVGHVDQGCPRPDSVVD
jgi:hypothetical protein